MALKIKSGQYYRNKSGSIRYIDRIIRDKVYWWDTCSSGSCYRRTFRSWASEIACDPPEKSKIDLQEPWIDGLRQIFLERVRRSSSE